jgi:hypothetical protein
MNRILGSGNRFGRFAPVVAILATSVAFADPGGMSVKGPGGTEATAMQTAAKRPMLAARVSRWLGDPVRKVQGPAGFDLQFRLIGGRFDGTFEIEGLPQSVPEGSAFDVQLKLTNIGGKKNIRVSSITVVGDGMMLITNLMETKVDPKSAETVASFRVPPQSSSGSSFLITVILSNGDKHVATLSFSPPQ